MLVLLSTQFIWGITTISGHNQNQKPTMTQRLSRSRQLLVNEPSAKPNGATVSVKTQPSADEAKETGGPSGPEPTRYGDWERKGRCIDF